MDFPILNNFIYTILFNATSEQKKGLSGQYLKALSSEKDALKFLETATREEKEYLLGHLGYQFIYLLFPDNISLAQLKDFIKQQKLEGNSGLYAHSDKEVRYYAAMIVQSIHGNTHHLNLEINRQGYHIQKWSRQYKSAKDEATKEVVENDTVLMRTLLSSSITMNYQPGLTGLTEECMQILLYLYINKNRYISYEELDALFCGYKGKYKKNAFSFSIRCMISEQLIQKSAIVKNQITITALGIKKCVEYRNAVLANNTNF